MSDLGQMIIEKKSLGASLASVLDVEFSSSEIHFLFLENDHN